MVNPILNVCLQNSHLMDIQTPGFSDPMSIENSELELNKKVDGYIVAFEENLVRENIIIRPLNELIANVLSDHQCSCETNLILKKITEKWSHNAIKCIFDNPLRSVLELIVNGHDAQNPAEAIGKFGLGFFSCLHFLDFEETGGSTIEITTTYRLEDDRLFSYRISLYKENDQIMVRFTSLSPAERTGTTIAIRPICNEFCDKSLEQIVHYAHYLDFFANGYTEVVRGGTQLHIGNTGSASRVKLILNPNEIIVEDHGVGISLKNACDKLLVPSASSKGDNRIKKNSKLSEAIAPKRVEYRGKQDPSKSFMLITVGRIVVTEIQLSDQIKNEEGKIVDLHLTDYPAGVTDITPARSDIKFGEQEDTFEYRYLRASINKAVEKTIDDPEMIHALYRSLQEWEACSSNQRIKGYFSGYLKQQLKELINADSKYIPATPLNLPAFKRMFPSAHFIPLEPVLVDYQYSRLESLILDSYGLQIAATENPVKKAVMQKGINGEALIGTRLIVVPDGSLEQTTDYQKPIIDDFGLMNHLFVPESILNKILSEGDQESLDSILFKFSYQVAECYSAFDYVLKPKMLPLIDENGNVKFCDAAPKIMTVQKTENTFSYSDKSYWARNLEKQIEVGLQLLNSFSEQELDRFYDQYFRLFADWGIKNRYMYDRFSFMKDFKNCLIGEYFRERYAKNNIGTIKSVIKHLIKCLYSDRENQQIKEFDPNVLKSIASVMVKKYSAEEMKELSMDEMWEEFDRIVLEIGENSAFKKSFSKREIVGQFLTEILSRYLDEKEMGNGNRISIENKVFFPFSLKSNIKELEELLFALTSVILVREFNLNPLYLLNYSENQSYREIIESAKSSFVFMMKTNNVEELGKPTDDYDLSPLLLKSDFIFHRYPHLKATFLRNLFAVISLNACFQTSTIFNEKQKFALKRQRNMVLELYQQYFMFNSRESLQDGNEMLNSQNEACFQRSLYWGTGCLVLSTLEAFADSPDLFDKLLAFQFQAINDQLDVAKRIEDEENGLLCYLPHVLTNTPFAHLNDENFRYLKPRSLKLIIRHSRNLQEFMFLGYCLRIASDKLYKNFKSKDVKDVQQAERLLELFIIHYLQEKIDPQLLAQLYQESRICTDDEKRFEMIKDTGIPKLLEEFFKSTYVISNILENNSFDVEASEILDTSVFEKPAAGCSLSMWMKYLFSDPDAFRQLDSQNPCFQLSQASRIRKNLNLGKIGQSVYGSERSCLESCAIELLQNALDAAKSFSKKLEDNDVVIERSVAARGTAISDITKVEFDVRLIPSKNDEQTSLVRFIVRDYIGLRDVKTLLTDLILPDYSNKNKDEGSVGEMGNGMCQIYQDARKVTIQTRLVSDPNKVYCLHLTPVRDIDTKDVIDLQMRLEDISEVLLGASEPFFGTEIQIDLLEKPNDISRMDALFGKFYMKNLSRNIAVKTATGTAIVLKDRSDKPENCELERPNTLLYSSLGSSEQAFTFSRLAFPFTLSVVTNGGVPFIELRPFLKMVGITDPVLVRKLSTGFLLNMPIGSYKPVQSRTKMILPGESREKIIRTLLNGLFQAELLDAQDHPKLLEKMFMHYSEKHGHFKQLTIRERLEKFEHEKDFSYSRFFTHFRPEFLQAASHKSFSEWIRYGYDTLIVDLNNYKLKAEIDYAEWSNMAREEMKKATGLSQAKSKVTRIKLRKEFQLINRNFDKGINGIFIKWKENLLSNENNPTVARFLEEPVISWFEKKILNFASPIAKDSLLILQLPELKNMDEIEKERFVLKQIEQLAKPLNVTSEERKILFGFVEDALQLYCQQFLKLLKNEKAESLLIELTYDLNSKVSGSYTHGNNMFSINLSDFPFSGLASMVIETITDGFYQENLTFQKLFKAIPGNAGVMNHELEHALSSPFRMHEPGLDATGNLADFEACAISRALQVKQNEIFLTWKKSLKDLYASKNFTRSPREWLPIISIYEEMSKVSATEFAKYYGLPIKL